MTETLHIHACTYCEIAFDDRKSSSTLKYSYCGYMCEIKDLGFCIDDFIRAEYEKVARVTTINLDNEVPIQLTA